MIHKFSRYLLTLVALFAMTAGAWAQTVTVTWTLTDLQANSGVTTFTKDGVTITCDTRMTGGKSFVGPVTISTTLGNFTKIEITGSNGAPITADGFTNDGNVSTWTGNAASISSPASIVNATQFVFTIAPAGPKVTINEAKTEASFEMPAYDATVSYELVRDLGTGVGVKVNGNQTWGETAASILMKKENGEYPAASTLEVALTDVLESNATIESSNYTWKLQRLADDGQTWTDLTLAEAKLSPGTYCIVATAADGTPYDGECDGEFTIYENYDLTLSPATDAHLKSVTVAGTAKTADEKGVIKNIEPGKKLKITTTGPDYIIRKATVTKTVNMLYIEASNHKLYYMEGETWRQAIDNHTDLNQGWQYGGMEVWFGNIVNVLKGNGAAVDPGSVIDPTKTYTL